MNYFKWDKDNKIDFEKVEKELGFKVHPNLKDFYLKNDIPDCRFKIDKNSINCIFNGMNWFEESDSLCVQFLKIDKNSEQEIIYNFNQESIYGDDENNFDIRYHLGYLIDYRGHMGLYFNNKTGEIDFCDFEYGADSWSESPRAVISDSVKDFLLLLK